MSSLSWRLNGGFSFVSSLSGLCFFPSSLRTLSLLSSRDESLCAQAQLDPKTKFKHRLGEDADGKHGKIRVHNFEVNSTSDAVAEDGSLEQAVSNMLEEE